MRTYKASLEKSRGELSAEQIRQGKCAAQHAARVARKNENKIQEAHRKLKHADPNYPAKQLAELDRRLGKNVGAKRERAKLLLAKDAVVAKVKAKRKKG